MSNIEKHASLLSVEVVSRQPLEYFLLSLSTTIFKVQHLLRHAHQAYAGLML